MFNFVKRCPICGDHKAYDMNITLDQFTEWSTNRDALIQNVMPQLEPDEREVFITGMCFDCQSQVFQ